jgi:hypothetical protein
LTGWFEKKKNLAVNHAPGCVMTTPSQLANRSLLTSRQPAPKYHSIFGLLIFFIRNKKQFPFLERFAQYKLSTLADFPNMQERRSCKDDLEVLGSQYFGLIDR